MARILKFRSFKEGAIFRPEDASVLRYAYHAALLEVRGRPAWRNSMGAQRIRNIIATEIIRQAQKGSTGEAYLSDCALVAVRAEYVRLVKCPVSV